MKCDFCGKDVPICRVAGGFEVCAGCYDRLLDRNASWNLKTSRKELLETMQLVEPLPLSPSTELGADTMPHGIVGR